MGRNGGETRCASESDRRRVRAGAGCKAARSRVAWKKNILVRARWRGAGSTSGSLQAGRPLAARIASVLSVPLHGRPLACLSKLLSVLKQRAFLRFIIARLTTRPFFHSYRPALLFPRPLGPLGCSLLPFFHLRPHLLFNLSARLLPPTSPLVPPRLFLPPLLESPSRSRSIHEPSNARMNGDEKGHRGVRTVASARQFEVAPSVT